MAPQTIRSSGISLTPGVNLCQTDLPLDWYQEELKPYAEEYLALPDRTPESVIPWLDGYVRPALDHFGDDLLLVAHYYMGGEIVKLIERYGGAVGDSYELALQAAQHPEKKVIVESAVHFMAEAIAILASEQQSVWITNPKAGCTMEMMAKDHMVLPLADQLIEHYGDDLLVIAYMNPSGRLKALAGSTGGAACTSSNAHLVVDWARRQGKKILFVPDQHLARNTADRLRIKQQRVVVLPDPLSPEIHAPIANWIDLDKAEMIVWGAYCGVHTVFTPAHVQYWQEHDHTVIVHPETPPEVVRAADRSGSTRQIWRTVMDAPAGSRFAVGTEGHFVRNLSEQASIRGVEVVHLGAVPNGSARISGCACATMSRNDPPHLAGILDLLRQGKAPDINHVLPGDMISETTASRDRLAPDERAELTRDARLALQRMIDITEA